MVQISYPGYVFQGIEVYNRNTCTLVFTANYAISLGTHDG
jgi:hypothetical protein